MSPRRRLRTRYERGETPPPGAPSEEVTALAPGSESLATVADPGAPSVEDGAHSPAPAPGDSLPGGAPGETLAPGYPLAGHASPAVPAPAQESEARATVAVPAPESGVDEAALAAREVGREAGRRRVRRLRAVATMVALAILAFATGLVVFNNLVMPRLIHGVGEVTVPDLTNLTVEQAEEALRPFGLQVSRAGERFDPAAPRGFVIAQEPGAGTTVRGSKRIAVIVSLGEEFSSVPELFGESVRSARMLIERAGLRSGSVVQAPSEDAGEGMVAGSDPGPETVLGRNTPVHLLVSTGAGAESFVMPDLLGREIAGVRRQLEALGFHLERSGAGTSVGTIVAQRPPPGSRITRATVIQLTASGRIIR